MSSDKNKLDQQIGQLTEAVQRREGSIMPELQTVIKPLEDVKEKLAETKQAAAAAESNDISLADMAVNSAKVHLQALMGSLKNIPPALAAIYNKISAMTGASNEGEASEAQQLAQRAEMEANAAEAQKSQQVLQTTLQAVAAGTTLVSGIFNSNLLADFNTDGFKSIVNLTENGPKVQSGEAAQMTGDLAAALTAMLVKSQSREV